MELSRANSLSLICRGKPGKNGSFSLALACLLPPRQGLSPHFLRITQQGGEKGESVPGICEVRPVECSNRAENLEHANVEC
jgi:hypothetical protein